MADAEELMKERKSFLKLKEDCFEKLRKEYSLEEEYLLLLDRALEHLWFKKKLEYEGVEYGESAVQNLLGRGLPPSLLAYSVESLAHSREPVRSPVAYLAKCIFALLLKGEEKAPVPASEQGGAVRVGQGISTAEGGKQSGFGSLDLDDLFGAALKSTYGDML